VWRELTCALPDLANECFVILQAENHCRLCARVHGTHKLFGFPAPFPVLHLPPPYLIGLFTRPFTFVLSGEMAVAYFKFHAPQGFWRLLNDGEAAVRLINGQSPHFVSWLLRCLESIGGRLVQ